MSDNSAVDELVRVQLQQSQPKLKNDAEIDGVSIMTMPLDVLKEHELQLSKDMALIETDLEFSDRGTEEWRFRAQKALGVKRFIVQRVRDRIRRLSKPNIVTTETAAQMKIAKREEGAEKQKALQVQRAQHLQKTALERAQLIERHSIYRAFFERAKLKLDPETFASLLEAAAKSVGNIAHGSMSQ